MRYRLSGLCNMTTARVALLLLTCMAAICHSKANQIPSISRLSLIRSELECADLSWSASVKPGEFESKNQWFLGKAGSFDQTSFKVSFAVYAVLVTVTAVGQFITVRYATADERDVQKRIRHIRYASTFIAFCLWFFYDFIFMCSRFVWLNSSPDADFEPWGFPDGKHDGDVYVPPALSPSVLLSSLSPSSPPSPPSPPSLSSLPLFSLPPFTSLLPGLFLLFRDFKSLFTHHLFSCTRG